MRLYNPKSGAEFVTASDDEDHVNVYLEAGWLPAPEPEAKPGYQPEPTVYAPVVAEKPKAKPKASSSSESTE